MVKKFLFFIGVAVILSSCGTTNKLTETITNLPSQEEAELLVNNHLDSLTPRVVFPLETASGPQVLCFAPIADSGSIKILSFLPQNGVWTLSHSENNHLFDESNLAFQGFQDTTAILYLYDSLSPVITFSTLLSDNNNNAEYDIFVYNPTTNILQKVGLIGKVLENGQIEGSSNKAFLDNPFIPEMQWALNRFDNNDSLIELGEDVIITNQALDWWFEKNPKASSSSKINFGGLPTNSSLVQAFNETKEKEKSGNYTVALFNHRGYTVIVAKRSSGEYMLAWAEPICKNKNTDPLLNTIYFEKGSQIAMFYYQGRKTYKLHLNLANGAIYKS